MALLDNLSTRERNLVSGFGVVFGLMMVFIAPWRISVWLAGKQKYNDDLRARIESVSNAKARLAVRKAAVGDVAGRYLNKAPPLGTVVDNAAKAAGLEIAVQTDVPPVPRGKLYSERATKLSIQKTGLRALTTFLERIETSGYPVSVTAFDLSKRMEPDAFTVSMTISAYDRTEAPKPGAPR